MSELLLPTKLFIPPQRPFLTPRPRLIRRMQEGSEAKLTLVAAPAGFGKTTLVTSWLASLTGRPAAWFSIDQNDNHFFRFFSYFIAAAQSVYPDFAQGLLAGLQSTQTPEEGATLTALLHELTALNQPLILVLDDYHLIQNQAVHEAVETLVEYMPPGLHLVITSREMPPLPVPRWRVRSQLTEIGPADLRFNNEEAAVFMARTMGLELDEEAVAALENRTEGWVAALQLAALSLKNNDDPARFIADFGGSDRHVADYLLEEVLNRQPPEVQRFLQQTAILERFSGPLCDAVTGAGTELGQMPAASAVLEQLETSNLFLIPLDAHRRWYRYHHLFAGLLADRLLREAGQRRVNDLHRRACQWFADEGFLDDAIYHAIQGQDYDEAARLIATIQNEKLWEQGNIGLLKEWGPKIPDVVYHKYPRAAMVVSAAELITGDFDNLYHHLDLFADAENVRGEYALFQSILVRNKGDFLKAVHLAREAGEFLDEEDVATRAIALMQIAVNMFQMGKLVDAGQTLAQARDYLKSSPVAVTNMELQLIQMMALLHMEQVDFAGAANLLQEGVDLARMGRKHPLPLIGILLAWLGDIAYEWNDLEKAADYYRQAKEWEKRTGISDIVIPVLLGEINLLSQRGDVAAAGPKLDKLRSLINNSRLEDIINQTATLVAYFNLRFGRLDEALLWANSLEIEADEKPVFAKRSFYRILMIVRLAECRSTGNSEPIPEILKLIDYFLNWAKRESFRHTTIEWLILRGLALELMAERPAAVRTVQEAIEMAKPGRLVRTFLDFGPALAPLLAECQGEYARKLFEALREDMRVQGLETAEPPPQSLPLDLTPRELDVLQAIVGGLSNKEIEEKLVISHNTVRTHIKNLYSKLGVSSRTQAAKRARESGVG